MTKATQLTTPDLDQFTGSEQWYRHGLNSNVLFTDGAKYVADAGGAYWLLDAIAIAQRSEKKVAAEEFQAWKLAVRVDRTATLTGDDGNGTIVYMQQLEFADFPLDEITALVRQQRHLSAERALRPTRLSKSRAMSTIGTNHRALK